MALFADIAAAVDIRQGRGRPAELGDRESELLLRQRRRDQLQRFGELRAEFGECYAAARAHDAPALVEPEWQERIAALERALLPLPPLDFLRQPAILYSMFLGERYAEPELRTIAGALGGRRLRPLLEEDAVGGPPLVHGHDGAYLTSSNLIHHLHHLVRFREATGVEPEAIDRVVEWGGGYGSMARLLARMHGGPLSYTIVDTPLFSCLQWLFLGSVFGRDRVSLALEEPVAVSPGRFTLVPLGLWHQVPHRAELFVSTWALNESGPVAQQAVAAGGWFGARHLLMGMHGGLNLADRAESEGAEVVPVGDFMPGQTYVLR